MGDKIANKKKKAKAAARPALKVVPAAPEMKGTAPKK